MGAARSLIAILLFLLGVLTAGCATTTAPWGWLPTPSEAQSSAFGGWISVKFQAGETKSKVHGELIAVESESILVLTPNGLTEIPMDTISHAKLTAYHANWGLLAGWTILGTLSTISHGVFLILTAPAWLITGITATVRQSFKPELKYPPAHWEQFRKYARFPQGLPEGLNRQSLRPK